MAISDNLLSIETRFQLDNTPKNFKIIDTFDYVGQGIALVDVEGALKITSPTNSVIHNTVLPAVDIDLDVQDYIDTISLPTDINGDVLKGTYIIEYTVQVIGAVDPGTYVKKFNYNYCYEDIVADVDLTVDLICSNLTSTDNTSYPSNVTSTTLTHTIHPPSGLNPTTYPVQTVSTTVNVYNPITTKTWTGKISNVLELTYAASGTFSEHFVDVTITGNSEKNIKDDINICSLQCNMRALTNRYFSSLENNPINAVQIYNNEVAPALLAAFEYTSSIECGNFELAETYYQKVLEFTGSQPDCACDESSEPTLILATCSGGGSGLTYVVDACNTNNAITVSSNTIGNETTYTVCFDDAIWTKINALTQVVVTSTDASVTITPTLVGYTMTYDLSVALSPATSPVHIFSGILDIDLSNKSAIPSLSWRASWSSVWGNKLQEPTLNNTQAIFADYQLSPNCFYLDGYVDQSGGEYPKPQLQIVEVVDSVGFGNGCDDLRNFQVIVNKIDTGNNRIYFKIMNQDGYPISGAELTELYNTIAISVIINA